MTALIIRQVMQLKYGQRDGVVIGNVSAFRDWSHISDVVDGYLLLALKGKPGEVYNQGSQRTNGVLSYILLALKESGMQPNSFSTMKKSVTVKDPAVMENSTYFGIKFPLTAVDRMLLNEELTLSIEHEGITIYTDERKINVIFNPTRFRHSDVPILLSNCQKTSKLRFSTSHSLNDIVRDQLDYCHNPSKRAQLDS